MWCPAAPLLSPSQAGQEPALCFTFRPLLHARCLLAEHQLYRAAGRKPTDFTKVLASSPRPAPAFPPFLRLWPKENTCQWGKQHRYIHMLLAQIELTRAIVNLVDKITIFMVLL